jgi:hypothetical protein
MKLADLARKIAVGYLFGGGGLLLYVVVVGACYGMYEPALLVFGTWSLTAGIALVVLHFLPARTTKPSPA